MEGQQLAGSTSDIETRIIPGIRDLGDGFKVRRALPVPERLMVGPFIFFDQLGPALFGAGQGLDVRPHPHINLATVTYLFEGELCHRDSLRTVQSIVPGEVNWMTAGRGIVHSERTPPSLREKGGGLSGIQVWVALPRRFEEAKPAFVHLGTKAVPVLDEPGVKARVIAGSLHGAKTKVPAYQEMFYADVQLEPGARFELGREQEERAAYVVEGEVEAGGESFTTGQLAVFRVGAQIVLEASGGPARVMVLGGEPMDGPRYIWWNFVSSSKDRIEQAKNTWRTKRFPIIPEETELIPLPVDGSVASYP